MRRRGHTWACAVVFVAFAWCTTPLAGAAGLRAITGHLDKPGYMVLAVSSNGVTSTVLAGSGAFRIVPPAATVSLQLRAPNGTYAGPIVLDQNANALRHARTAFARAQRTVKQAKTALASARKNLRSARGRQAKNRASRRLGQAAVRLRKALAQLTVAGRLLTAAQKQRSARARWATVGVKAGAALGQVKVRTAAGYALAGGLSEAAWSAWVNPTWSGQAKGGVPLGARNVGRVRSTLLNGAFMGDLDRDGVPNSLDIDKNGNLILNGFDKHAASASAAADTMPPLTLGAGTLLEEWGNWSGPSENSPNTQPVNVNAPGITDADINAAFNRALIFGVGFGAGPVRVLTAGELDCGGLSYCSAGGTGMRVNSSYPQADPNPQPFPACCDPDGNGQGALDPNGGTIPTSFLGVFLEPHASIDQIRAGDVLVAHLACQPGAMGCESRFHGDAAGTVGLVLDTVTALASYTDAQGTHDVSYPVVPGSTLPVVANASGEVVLKLTFWRPQRRAVPEEVAAGAGQWIDVGGMDYSAGNPRCPASAYSEIDPSLTAIERDHLFGSGVLVLADSAHDQPANRADTFSYTLNLSQCLDAHGWHPGGTAAFLFDSQLGAGDNADSGYRFYWQP